jgi:N-acetylglucosaminyl-diphospho-decaprenol L-rhamnosyltransferase
MSTLDGAQVGRAAAVGLAAMPEHPSPAPRVDAVIVSYNNRDTLRACVHPLVQHDGVGVTVVDNASPDASLEAVADLPVRAVQSGRNAGFAAGCNLGAARGRAPLILLLNPDAEVQAGALERMIEVFDSDADGAVVLVGPRLLAADGSLMHSMRRYQRSSSTWARAFYLHRLFPRVRWANEIDARAEAYDAPASPEWVSGACMLVRRAAFESVGGFDERFFMYCEDADLCKRLRVAGGDVRYEPSAIVVHRGGHSAPRASLYGVLACSRIAYARTHDGRVSAAVQQAGLAAEALSHALVGLAGRPASVRGHGAALRASLARAAS